MAFRFGMKLAVLGCGKMGGALLKGALAAGVCKADDVTLADAYVAAAEALAGECPGAKVAGTNGEAVVAADTVLLCVKPHDMVAMLEGLGNKAEGRLFISIAAGVTLDALEHGLPVESRVVRVMPNTPVLIGKGAAAYAPGKRATEEDSAAVESLLGAVGEVVQVKEGLLDAVTGLSGSGPAYVYTMIEALADGGVLMGIPKAQALKLAAQTVAGAAEMVRSTGLHPAELRDQVTSPGGTTIAGLATLEERGIRSALIEAVREATERSQELGG